jgi:hypothetical protein
VEGEYRFSEPFSQVDDLVIFFSDLPSSGPGVYTVVILLPPQFKSIYLLWVLVSTNYGKPIIPLSVAVVGYGSSLP